MSRCLILCGGDCSAKTIMNSYSASDFIICADSGYDYAVKYGVIPHLLIGDFDSISNIPDGIDKIKLPVEKDITDSEAAIIEGINRGYTEFLILGGTGGRFEHTFANISLMAKYTKLGYIIKMIDDNHSFFCIYNSSLKLTKKGSQQISVFAFGENAEGVYETGFHYPLSNFTLSPFVPLGISNDIVADYGEISVENGTLVVIETIL